MQQAVTGVLIALLTGGLHGAWLAWDQQKELNPLTGSETGPYEAWRVVGLVLCLGAVAFWAGWRGSTPASALAMPLALSLCFAIDATTGPDTGPNDGLWVVGSVLLFVVTAFGALATSHAAVAARSFVHRRRGDPAI